LRLQEIRNSLKENEELIPGTDAAFVRTRRWIGDHLYFTYKTKYVRVNRKNRKSGWVKDEKWGTAAWDEEE
jgi:hypothetical protein